MITIKKNKKDFEFTVKMILTEGKIFSIIHALSEYKEKSVIGCEMYNSLVNAWAESQKTI